MSELRNLLNQATPGPWGIEHSEGYITGRLYREGVERGGLPVYVVGQTPIGEGVIDRADAALIVYLVNRAEDIAALIEAAQSFLDSEYPDGTAHPADRSAANLRTALLPFEAKP